MQFLVANMSNRTVTASPAPSSYEMLGGRALTSKLLFDMVTPKSSPLGPDNKLIIAPGLLAGTRVPCSGRLSVGGISPLTGGIKEANAGGTAAHMLARIGIKAVIIEGKAPPGISYILRIHSAGAELIEDDSLSGLNNYEACKRIREKYGEKVSIILAGIASEKRFANATVAVTDPSGNPSRHAARGGLGSVMFSRGIKAVIIDVKNSDFINFKLPAQFNDLSMKWSKELIETKKVLSLYGTANLVGVINELGGLATRNFSSGKFELAENIAAEKLVSNIKSRGGNPTHACQQGCPIRCSNTYHDKNGQFLTSSLEFETIALTGSNLGIGDLDVIAQIDRFCDEFGMDTIELGCTLGVLMEAGILSFGDADGVFELIDEIRRETVLGRLIGQGVSITGKVLGVERIPSVKGQGLAAYDPRALKGTGVTYATSPMGADHTAGNCLPGRTGYRSETQKVLDTTKSEGQIELSRDMQLMHTVCDAMGLCIFVGANTDTMKKLSELLSLRFQRQVTVDDIISLARNTLLLEVEYNRRSGILESDNDLPEFFRREPLENGLTFDLDRNELQNFYKMTDATPSA